MYNIVFISWVGWSVQSTHSIVSDICPKPPVCDPPSLATIVSHYQAVKMDFWFKSHKLDRKEEMRVRGEVLDTLYVMKK